MGRAATNSKLTPAEKKAWQAELTKVCSVFSGRRKCYKDDINESVITWYNKYLVLMAQKKLIAEELIKL